MLGTLRDDSDAWSHEGDVVDSNLPPLLLGQDSNTHTEDTQEEAALDEDILGSRGRHSGRGTGSSVRRLDADLAGGGVDATGRRRQVRDARAGMIRVYGVGGGVIHGIVGGRWGHSAGAVGRALRVALLALLDSDGGGHGGRRGDGAGALGVVSSDHGDTSGQDGEEAWGVHLECWEETVDKLGVIASLDSSRVNDAVYS